MQMPAPSTPARDYVVFRIDGVEYVLPAENVREVLRTKGTDLKQVAGSGPVRYRLMTQGILVPLVGLQREHRIRPRSCIILLQSPRAGLLVDSVSRVASVPAERESNGRVRLGTKWRTILEAPRLIQWALDQNRAKLQVV